MAVEEKDLEQKRAKADKLREQIAEAEAKAAENTTAQQAEIEGAQLDTEIARLERRLAEAKEAAKVSVAKESASGVMDQVTEQLEAAVAHQQAPIGVVETPAEKQADEKKE